MKKVREEQTSYFNIYMESRNRHQWAYLQGRNNRDTDVGNRLMEPVREGKGRTNRESSIDIYTLSCVK